MNGSIVVVVTAIVSGSLWVLEQSEWIPFKRLRTAVVQSALAVFVVSMLVFPGAYHDALTSFVDRTTNDMLDRIQPAIDVLVPPVTTTDI